MKKIYTLLFILLIGFSLEAQEVVSSGGKTQTTADYELSWTVGEVVTATVSNGENTLTQGFHQSKLIVTALSEPVVLELNVKVYPNPTSRFVIVHQGKAGMKIHYALFNISGKLLQQKFIVETDTPLDMKDYSSGTELTMCGCVYS